MNDVLFGHGVVGKATAKAFNIRRWFDWADGNYFPLTGLKEHLAEARWVWICVPTPSATALGGMTVNRAGVPVGGCDTSIVEKVIEDVSAVCFGNNAAKDKTFVIRSTVIPGTAKRLAEKHGVDIVSFPEFLSERTADRDVRNPWLIVAAGRSVDRFIADHHDWFCWKNRCVFTDNSSAEMVKCAYNCLFATLTVFGNQIFDACEASGVSYQDVREALFKMPWREHNHLDPKKDGYRGYAGKCLPKDVKALIAEYNLPLLRAVDEINNQLLKEHAR